MNRERRLIISKQPIPKDVGTAAAPSQSLNQVLQVEWELFRMLMPDANCPFRMETPERIDIRSCPRRECLVKPDPVGDFKDHSHNPPDEIQYHLQIQQNSSRT